MGNSLNLPDLLYSHYAISSLQLELLCRSIMPNLEILCSPFPKPSLDPHALKSAVNLTRNIRWRMHPALLRVSSSFSFQLAVSVFDRTGD